MARPVVADVLVGAHTNRKRRRGEDTRGATETHAKGPSEAALLSDCGGGFQDAERRAVHRSPGHVRPVKVAGCRRAQAGASAGMAEKRRATVGHGPEPVAQGG